MWSYVGEYLQWFYTFLPSWSAFSTLLRYGPKEEPFELSMVMQDRVDSFKQYIGVAWEEDIPEHLQLLEIYWKLCFPDQPFQRKDKRWTEVGFQGPDPGTDFRGAGVFGLRHLIFFAQTHPDEFQRFQKSGYPLSIAGLNITMLIYSCLGWRSKKLEIDTSKKRAL
jgi:engulfment and cell motility protein 2